MYSYLRIKKIKEDLRSLIAELKVNPQYKGILKSLEISEFESAIAEYDHVLNAIGVSGYCNNKELNSGFAVTEHFISKIKSEIDAINRKR